MLLVELFSGTGSVGKIARKMGWDVISVDADPSHGATYTTDILKLDYKSMPVPDFVWASPPCTTYSLAATWFRHRDPDTGKAFTQDARKADEVVKRTLKIIRYWNTKNERLRFCIENPRGYLRKMPFMASLTMTHVWYVDYDWPARKPTDLWTNFPLTLKAPGSSAKREVVRMGAGKWRQAFRESLNLPEGISQAVMLGMIPPKLVRDVLKQMERSVPSTRRKSPKK
jgi:hypothetical protein